VCINWGRAAGTGQPSRGYAHQLNAEFLQEKRGLKARIIDGKKMASVIHSEVAEEVKVMVQQGQRSVIDKTFYYVRNCVLLSYRKHIN